MNKFTATQYLQYEQVNHKLISCKHCHIFTTECLLFNLPLLPLTKFTVQRYTSCILH